MLLAGISKFFPNSLDVQLLPSYTSGDSSRGLMQSLGLLLKGKAREKVMCWENKLQTIGKQNLPEVNAQNAHNMDKNTHTLSSLLKT